MKTLLAAAVALATLANAANADARTAVVQVPCRDKGANGHTALDITILPAWATAKFLQVDKKTGGSDWRHFPTVTVLFMRHMRDGEEKTLGVIPDEQMRICTVRVRG